jgi:glucose-1-phosphate cytidylyltransferase
MKVVLFCGGLGLRLRDYADHIPKPMVSIGYRPILWHVMKYFAHFGHKEFILCLGHRSDVIKQYFLNYDESLSNDFVLSNGGKTIALASTDIHDWKITFVDTGLQSNIGQRLMAVEKHLMDEDVFFATYADGLTDLDLTSYIDYARGQNKVASFLSVRPNLSYHVVQTGHGGLVTGIKEVTQCGIRINAGFFVLKRDIFKYMQPGDELVIQPFQRLIHEKQLVAFEYNGFFAAMDTFKDKQYLDTLHEDGQPPWEVWTNANGSAKRISHSHQRTSATTAHRFDLTSTLREAKKFDNVDVLGGSHGTVGRTAS